MKSNLRKEMMVQLSPETFMEELSVQNGTTCDDFFVDDLLDFSHVEEEPEQQQQKEQDLVCVSLQKENPCQEPYAFKPDYSSLPTTELSVLVFFFFSSILFLTGSACFVLVVDESWNFYRRMTWRTSSGCLISSRIPSRNSLRRSPP